MIDDRIEIRTGADSDCEPVIALLMRQLREHDIDLPVSRARRAVEELLTQNIRGFIVIAIQGAATVGVAYVSFAWTLEHGGKSAWLDELFVVPEARNRGIGEALVAAVVDKAKATGCSAIDLEVDSQHARAEHLYARAGFTSLPRARWVLTLTPESEFLSNQ